MQSRARSRLPGASVDARLVTGRPTQRDPTRSESWVGDPRARPRALTPAPPALPHDRSTSRNDRGMPPAPPDVRGRHGARHLPGLSIDSCNLALRAPDGDGFLGDLASQTAFRDLLDQARREDRTGADPFGETPTPEIAKKAIDLVLVGGDADAAHLVHVAVEAWAQRMARVIHGFLDAPEWRGVQGIVLGGGWPESEAGQLAIRRAARLLAKDGAPVELHVLAHDADEGGLLGWIPLLPDAATQDHDAFLAVDIGGTNLRCGLVEHGLRGAPDGSAARVVESMQWRHAQDDPARDEAVARMAGMLNGLGALARTLRIRLAPFVGIACPGEMREDGGIEHGAQNLPGQWEAPFNLPRALGELLDRVDGAPTTVLMHNDAVVQGLSERHRMRAMQRWGVLTIGTGLGNASYTNQAD